MSQEWIYTIVFGAWLLGAAAFVIGLHRMNSPATARDGNRLSALGMTIAVLTTLFYLITREGGLSIAALVIILVGFVIGGVTFSGSLIASGKLQGLISGKPIVVPGGRLVTGGLALIAVLGFVTLVLGAGGALTLSTSLKTLVLFVVIAAGLTFGITMVLPIGGAADPALLFLFEPLS